jgi:hypothetical protein
LSPFAWSRYFLLKGQHHSPLALYFMDSGLFCFDVVGYEQAKGRRETSISGGSGMEATTFCVFGRPQLLLGSLMDDPALFDQSMIRQLK